METDQHSSSVLTLMGAGVLRYCRCGCGRLVERGFYASEDCRKREYNLRRRNDPHARAAHRLETRRQRLRRRLTKSPRASVMLERVRAYYRVMMRFGQNPRHCWRWMPALEIRKRLGEDIVRKGKGRLEWNTPRQNFSHNMQALVAAGLVETRRGRWGIHYRIKRVDWTFANGKRREGIGRERIVGVCPSGA